ncbi:MAG: dUTP diphosphatase [Defluviitaleaceae bacterium]|nr:dUTP diphosphatase [Defluviitaleaceae bacterium]
MENNRSFFKIIKTDDAKDLPLPMRMSQGASGIDLYAKVDGDSIIKCGEVQIIPTGVCVSVPLGYEVQIRPRSGLAAKHGVTVLNTPGTIDSDYRGEICVILINLGKVDYTIKRGDRIAQMVISSVVTMDFIEVNTLDDTERGSGRFGHTGV